MNAQQVDLWQDVPEKPARKALPMVKLTDGDRFFAIGKQTNFPQFSFSLGRGVIGTIQAGEENWLRFCQNADVYVVSIALQTAQQKEAAS